MLVWFAESSVVGRERQGWDKLFTGVTCPEPQWLGGTEAGCVHICWPLFSLCYLQRCLSSSRCTMWGPEPHSPAPCALPLVPIPGVALPAFHRLYDCFVSKVPFWQSHREPPISDLDPNSGRTHFLSSCSLCWRMWWARYGMETVTPYCSPARAPVPTWPL